jgi:GGDEF domain-containing protein
MISLSRYLNRAESDDSTQEGDVPHRAIALLIQAMGVHTLDFNHPDYQAFRTDLHRVQTSITPNLSSTDLLVQVGGAITIFADYNRRATGRMRLQFHEFQDVISSLGNAIQRTVNASQLSLQQLHEIQEQLVAADSGQDLVALKSRLANCLDRMVTEVEEHHSHSTHGLACIQQGVEGLRENSGFLLGPDALDPVTGLPLRPQAEAALTEAAGQPQQFPVGVIFVPGRLKIIYDRFGTTVGNQLLARLATFLGSGINPEGGFYRWEGASMLAIITRKVPFDRLRVEVGKLAASIPPDEVDVGGGRAAIIGLSASWALFPIRHPVKQVILQMDQFVRNLTPEGAHATR